MTDKEKQLIIEVLKALEGIKRTLLSVLKQSSFST